MTGEGGGMAMHYFNGLIEGGGLRRRHVIPIQD